MLFRRETLARVARGEVDLAFRRWRRPTVRAGGRLRTRIGELAIDGVEIVGRAAIRAEDARRAGYDSRESLLAELDKHAEGEIFRVEFHLGGPDPRIALREQADLDADALDALVARLDRLDRASRAGSWTRATLDLIERHPGRRAPDLAAEIGLEKVPFKRNVRKLKELGLTESLEVGYRLSPRGETLAAFLKEQSGR